MKKLLHNINNKIKNSDGMTSLEAVIGTLIFLMLFCALLDLIMLSNQFSTLTDTGKEVARTLSVQGGALEEKPSGYASNYYTIERLSSLTQRNMRSAGFKDCDWSVVVEYDQYYDETDPDNPHSVQLPDVQRMTMISYDGAEMSYQATPKIDYLSDFSVKIYAQYEWKFLKVFFHNRKSSISVTMPGVSEWKYNYDAWPSER